MNEELKIIISAVTDGAKKGIQGIKKELNGVSGSAKGASAGFGAAMKAFGKVALVAVGAVAAVGAAIVALGKKTLDYQRVQAKLNAAFQAAGSTAKQAAESYQGLYRFLGDTDTSVEAASHLAKLTTNQKELAEWSRICQGVYATFGDSLKIESLTEAANETARVGKVTGAFADALNWAGASEDEFNAKLEKTTSFAEREALIRSTLNGLYGDAADIYEQNNKALLDYNESQARLEASMGAAGKAVTPLLTSLNNLCAALFDALRPALEAIIPAIATFISWITKGIEAVLGFFGVVSGGSTTVSTFTEMGTGIAGAAQGAGKLTSGLEGAEKAAEKVKKATMGFDELNVLSSGSSSSGGGSGSGASSGPAYMAPTVDASKFTVEVEQTETKTSGFAKTMKKFAEEIKDVFTPTITAWSSGFDTIKKSWDKAKGNFASGAVDIKDSLVTITKYVVGDFVPDIVNSFSKNLAPMITDVFGFTVEQGGKDFKLFGKITNDVTKNIMIPAFNTLKGVIKDVFKAWGDAWSSKGKPLLDSAGKALDHIRDTFLKLYNNHIKPTVEKIIKTFKDAWTSTLEPVYRKVVDAALEIGQCVLDIYNKFLKPVIDWIMSNIMPKVQTVINRCIDYFGELLKATGRIIGGITDTIKGIVQFLTGVFTGDWKRAWEGIKNIFSGTWESIKGVAQAAWAAIKHIFDPQIIKAFFSGCWEVIKGVFSGVGNWFSSLFSAAWTGIKTAWNGVGNWFSGIWTNIKNVFSPVADWFENTFTKAWTNVKNVFSTGGKIFDGIKDGILSGLKSVINAIIGGINKVISVPFNGLNSALRTIRNTSIAGFKPFEWLPTISVPQIPKLARGGVIDQATLALIGERGKEAVVPLENNTEWIDKLVEKLAARESGPSKIVLMLDGKELGWANINSINSITRQTGALQLVLA